MRRLSLLVLACGLVAVSAGPALAAAPEKTAWYSAATVGGTAVPAPTLAEGDLRVSGAGERPTAYATLLLTSPGTSGGELVLAVRPGSAVGTPELSACPTKTSSWQEGGNQPFEEGPGYDCAAGSVFGTLSADGTSVSFPLDSSVQPTGGTISIAIAPLTEGTTPFSVDLGDPEYTPSGAAAAAPAAPAQESAPDAGTPGAAPAEVPAGGLSGAVAEPAPAAPADDAPAPALAGVEAALPESAPEAPALPEAEVALPVAPTTVLPPAQLAAGQAADDDDGPRLLALLTLVGVSAGAGYAAGQQRSAPRLLGGRAAAAGSTALAVAAPPAPTDAAAPRGIGRFSRTRDSAPRSLR